MDEGQLVLFLQRQCVNIGLVVRVARQHDLAAEFFHRVDLDNRRRRRHDDHRTTAELLRRERHALGVVAGRGGDYAALALRRGQVRHLVVRAAQLEGKHGLHVLALEQHTVAGAGRDVRRRFQRRLDRHVVHAGVEDLFQIVGVHGAEEMRQRAKD